jgi:hypothetical protein
MVLNRTCTCNECAIGNFLLCEHYNISKSKVTVMHKDGACYVCGEWTKSLSANPSEWGFSFPHIDGKGSMRHYHTKCLYPILKGIKDGE